MLALTVNALPVILLNLATVPLTKPLETSVLILPVVAVSVAKEPASPVTVAPETVFALTESMLIAPEGLRLPDTRFTKPDKTIDLSLPPSVNVTVSILIRQ